MKRCTIRIPEHLKEELIKMAIKKGKSFNAIIIANLNKSIREDCKN